VIDLIIYWAGVITIGLLALALASVILIILWFHLATNIVFIYITLKSYYANPELEVFEPSYTSKIGWQARWVFNRLTCMSRVLWDGEIRSKGFIYSCHGLIPRAKLIGKL